MPSIVFFDSEIHTETKEILDLGAVKHDGSVFHSARQGEFSRFVSGSEFICGHNVIAHDLKYINGLFIGNYKVIDTLYISPLMFPQKPYHHLLKDDKLDTDELNNPLNDSKKAMELFYDEVDAFNTLNSRMKRIYCALLGNCAEFSGFFDYMDFHGDFNAEELIRERFSVQICANASLDSLTMHYPKELAYCLALIDSSDRQSIIPHWVHINFPMIEYVMKTLRGVSCGRCEYCAKAFNMLTSLKKYFGYDNFRTYDGEPLQEKAARAAADNKSLIAVFPTGGGKSITFQLPALMAGESCRGLTVVISPLQSLMKDQVDNLVSKSIYDGATINGLLDPIERAQAIENVSNGLVSILYLSPESLRSKTIESLLVKRHISRFVIDEAHCFSAWGQDFRVDYLYIGDFINELQEKKQLTYSIPVSCFTATAKQKVISDIRDYFKQKLGLELEIYATGAARNNLHYEVIYKDNDEEKYITLRNLIQQKSCPTIVYVSKVKRTFSIAKKLNDDGFSALPYNGKMESSEKIENQEKFMNDEVQIIVATSAFGMGVDKSDVGLVVHFDISPSLEDYVQEAGRAGRDERINADCYVLFKDEDLDGHFMMLNQSKLSIKEINQVWRAIKDLSRRRVSFTRSALELARDAGWSDTQSDMETRVKNAVNALENAGYIKRGKNIPHIYATSVKVKSYIEASEIINASTKLNEKQKVYAGRIIKSIISARSIAKADNAEAESRVDYLSDILAIPKEETIYCLNVMREENILANERDMKAFFYKGDTQNKSNRILARFTKLERFLLSYISEDGKAYNLKEINQNAADSGVVTSRVKDIRTILYFWTIKEYIDKSSCSDEKLVNISPKQALRELTKRFEHRAELCEKIIDYMFEIAKTSLDYAPVEFSVMELVRSCKENIITDKDIDIYDIEESLLYLSKISAINIEGGFLVLYSSMQITRLEEDNRIQYKQEDYKQLNEFYRQKIQQIHIVGEYANMMVRDYSAATLFVSDYFGMDYKQFIAKYFSGERMAQIERNITPEKFTRIFGGLSERQQEIVDDKSKYIVVSAGPGSGKTTLLVRKLASLYQLEDTKHEQLLMVTFSRAAAIEFRVRLTELLKGAVRYMEIKTFHSYCFDLMGKIGTLESSTDIVARATEAILNGEVEQGQITKTVVVIDEAQDMDSKEYALIKALMERNEDMRVIAVGDDDQNIYEFRGSNSKYLESFITEYGAVKYEMTDNYRSCRSICAFANAYAATLSKRMKSQPINAVKDEQGVVKLIRHKSNNLEQAVVNSVKESYTSGTAAVLTSTNDEALQMMGLLIKEGFRAKLIQSRDGFRLNNLVELRYFMGKISGSVPIISDEVWESAKQKTAEYFSRSECLETVMNMIAMFEKTCETKYRSDFEAFVWESEYEDFYTDDKDVITVSTIHKAKGREFDNVYIMLNDVKEKTLDKTKRAVYVGITRAKSVLYVHDNCGVFDNISVDGIQKINDEQKYPEPDELVISLSLRDVNLGFFKSKKELIKQLQAGDFLSLRGNMLYTVVNGKQQDIAPLSRDCYEKITKLNTVGYKANGGAIRFIVAWKGKDAAENEPEVPVVLGDLKLVR